MKTKKLFMLFLSVLLAVTLSVFAFACSNDKDLEPTSLTINSKTEVTIEVGQEYTLLYSCNGTVTVSASGGTYDENSHKFSASEAGVYTLVVTGVEEGKAETVVNVTVTVTAGADKTVINDAIKKANALIASDYTTGSWATLASAKAAANSILNAYGKTQDEVNAAAQEIEDAIANLVPAAITKATVSDEKIVVGTTNYFAEDYENFDEVVADIEELNADASVKLNSVYTAKLAEILDTLVAKPVLNVAGAPDGIMLVEELVPYEMTATADEGASIVWKLNGTKVADGETYTYTPASFDETFKIEVTTTVGEGTGAREKTVVYEGAFAHTAYTISSAMADKITVDDNVIHTEKASWGDAKGTKVVLSDLLFSGDVTVYFDLKFEEVGSPAVMGIFFLNANGASIDNWAVVNGNTGFIEVATADSEAAKVRVNASTTTLNKTYHFKATRYIEGGKGYLSIWQLDDNGRVLVENLGNNIAKDYADAVKIGIQTENAKGTISNLRVELGAEILDKSVLGEAIRTCGTPEYLRSDYTAESYSNYTTALGTARSVYNSTSATQAQIEGAASALTAAYAGLTLEEVDYIEIEENSASFAVNGETYYKVNYKNYDDVVDAINDLKAQQVKPISVYNAKVAEIVATLEEAASITVTPSYETGVHLVQSIPTDPITFTADVAENTTVEWKLNGKVVTEGLTNNGLTLTYTPVEGEYRVEAVAKFGAAVSSPVVLTGGFYLTDYKVHENYTDKISVENGVINVHSGATNWNDQRGQKVILDNINIEGAFVVTMDVKFKTNAIMALFLLNHQGGNGGPSYVVVNNGSRFLGVGINQDGGEPHYGFPEGSTIADNGNTFTLRVTRSNDNGTWHLVGEMLDAAGNVIVKGDRTGCRSDRITFGIQTEAGTFEVSNINVVSGTVINKDAINETIAAIAETDKTIHLKNLYVNYEENEAKAYHAARQEIFDAYYDANSTKARIFAAIENYNSALTALLKAEKQLVKAQVAADSFTYNGVTYSVADYTNLTGEDAETEYVLALVTALNANEEINNIYDYDNAIKALIESLVPALTFSVTGAPASGDVLVNSLPEYTITVDTNATTIVWTVDGSVLEAGDARLSNEGKTLTYTATEFGEFSIEVAVEDGDQHTDSRTFAGKFVNALYTANVSGASVSNNVISINENYGWDNNKGKKVTLNDLYLYGEFTVSFDLKFTSESGAIMAMFLLTDSAVTDANADSGIWVAVNQNSNFLEMAVNGKNNRRYVMPEGTTAGLMHISLTRYLNAEDGLYYYYAQLLDDDGNALPLIWNKDKGYDEQVYYKNDSKDAGAEWKSVYDSSFKLGIQSEAGKFTVSNINLITNENTVIIDKTALRLAINNAQTYILNDYTEATAEVVRTALASAINILNKHDFSYDDENKLNQAEVDAARASLVEAVNALELIDRQTYSAAIESGDSSFTYANVTYHGYNYSNFTEVLAKVKALNEGEDKGKTAYDRAIKAIIAELEAAVNVEITGIADGNYIVEKFLVYTLTANATSSNANPTFAYEWTVNGNVVEGATAATYDLTAAEGVFVITVKVTDTANSNTYATATVSVSFIEETYTVPESLKDKVTVTDNVVETVDFTGWDPNRGKKVLFENLIFNGSFSVTMDVNVKEVSGGAHVITLHVFNADTINGEATTYGCLRFQDNRLEVRSGDSKSEPITIDRSKTVTVKVTIYKYSSNNFVRTMFSVKNQTTGEWFDYSPDAQVTNYNLEHGLAVGVNIENVKATFSNFRYELLKDVKYGEEACIDGSVKSKLALSKALAECTANVDEYYHCEERTAYAEALAAAQKAISNNAADADYDSCVEPLKAAYEALIAKNPIKPDVEVDFEGYYTNYQDITEPHDIVANVSVKEQVEGAGEITGVYWAYDFTAEGGATVQGTTQSAVNANVLTVGTEKGKYTNVLIHFTYGTTEYAYACKDITVKSIVLKSNVDWIKVNGDGTANMSGGGSWDRKDQLNVGGEWTNQFELTFTANYDTNSTGNYRIMHINLFGSNIRLIFGWRRDEGENRDTTYWFGHDNDVAWDNISQANDKDNYDWIKGNANGEGVKFGVKMVNVNGTYQVTFTVYGEGDKVIRSITSNITTNDWTQIHIAFENATVKLDDFMLMC